MVLFLPGRVPNLELYRLVVIIELLGHEGRAQGRVRVFFEVFGHEAEEDARLSDAWWLGARGYRHRLGARP